MRRVGMNGGALARATPFGPLCKATGHSRSLGQSAAVPAQFSGAWPVCLCRSKWWRYALNAPLGSALPPVGRGCGKAGEKRRMLAFQSKRGLPGPFRCESHSVPKRDLAADRSSVAQTRSCCTTIWATRVGGTRISRIRRCQVARAGRKATCALRLWVRWPRHPGPEGVSLTVHRLACAQSLETSSTRGLSRT